MSSMATLPLALAPPGIIITASLDGHAVLHFDGRDIRMDRLLLADQRRLCAALAQAQNLVLTHQPGPSELVQFLDAVETQANLRDATDASTVFAPIAEAITAAHAGLKTSAATEITS